MNNQNVLRSGLNAADPALRPLAPGKKNDDIKAPPNTKTFHPEIFRQNMVAALGNHPIGYTLVISKDGKLVDSASLGYARMAQDGARLHNINRRMNIASITKWLTGMCAVKMLAEKGISLDSPIYPYLPAYWKPGKAVKSITFHELLTHHSGIANATIDYSTFYAGLKSAIESPLADDKKGYKYSNVNFALFRIMMAYIDDKQHALANEAEHMANGDSVGHDQFLTLYYMSRMEDKIFKPAGVTGATTNETARAEITLAYSSTNTALAGGYPGDWTFKSGGGGYYLSAYELAKILAYANHTEDIITNAQRVLMEKNLYGFDADDSPLTAYGQGYGKGGGLGWEDNGIPKTQAGDRGLQTKFAKLPGGVELVLFVNSIPDGYTDYLDMIRTAYESAWK